jgi:hypothetical protein
MWCRKESAFASLSRPSAPEPGSNPRADDPQNPTLKVELPGTGAAQRRPSPHSVAKNSAVRLRNKANRFSRSSAGSLLSESGDISFIKLFSVRTFAVTSESRRPSAAWSAEAGMPASRRRAAIFAGSFTAVSRKSGL